MICNMYKLCSLHYICQFGLYKYPQYRIASLFKALSPGQNDRRFSEAYPDAFSSMKTFGFRLKFHLMLFLRVQLTVFQC